MQTLSLTSASSLKQYQAWCYVNEVINNSIMA